MYKLLLDESPLIVLPSLAKEIGLNEAIVLQQLHYWLQTKKAKKQTANFKQGRWWVYNSYREWREEAFIFWSEVTIQRIFLSLEKSGLVIADYLADDKEDRRKWYTIDYVVYQDLVEAKVEATLSSCEDAPYQVDRVGDINLIPSTVSKRYGGGHQVDVVNKETKTAAKIASKTATAESKAPQEIAAIPTETAGSAAAVLIASLEEAEVNRADAERLALVLPDECRRQLAYLPFVETFKSSRGAYLRTAIEQGFAPPKGWHEAQKRQEIGQKRIRQAEMTAGQQAEDERRQALLEREKARLQAECPEAWARLLEEADAGLAKPVRARPDGPAYKPALDAKINALIAARLALQEAMQGATA